MENMYILLPQRRLRVMIIYMLSCAKFSAIINLLLVGHNKKSRNMLMPIRQTYDIIPDIMQKIKRG